MPAGLGAAVRAIRERGNPYAMEPEGRLEAFPKELRDLPRADVAEPEALVYLGCVPSLIDTKMAPATLRLLEKAGVRIASLGDKERCCGYLARLAGDEEGFVRAARLNVELLEATKAGVVVTPCAGCYRTMSRLYPEAGVALGPRVRHLVDYVLELVRAGRLALGKPYAKKVAYHDPCDLGRQMGYYDPPRELLKAVPGLELVEMARTREQARCCGGGGGLGAVDPDLSVEVALLRLRDAEAAGADVLVSACASCKKNLSKGAALLRRQGGRQIKVVDISEVVFSALGPA
jgi:glycolate oxidase